MSIISRAGSPFIVPITDPGEIQTTNQNVGKNQQAFITAKVIDFFADPKILSESKKLLIKDSVEKSALVNSMPINSIWCQIIEANRQDQQVAYPFFPSHLCLPVKPAEQVWVFYSETDQVYYWVCRKPGDYISEDANYTHIDRIVNQPIIQGQPGVETVMSSKDAFNGNIKNTFNFPQGKTNSIYDKTSGIQIDDETIINQSQEYQDNFIQEPVPRIVRQPGDLVIQGSNNTSVKLGSSTSAPGSGIIDIVTGRFIMTNPVNNTRNNQEIDKTKPASFDGQFDFFNDLARIYLGMNENVDLDFEIKIKGIDGSGAGGCVVVKSDQVRLIANKDVKITVGDTGAGIVIKADGNIVIVPSSSGVIKLGGEDANKAILCQDAIETIPGNVTAPPVISTAGGIIGSSTISGTGLFASKILVK